MVLLIAEHEIEAGEDVIILEGVDGCKKVVLRVSEELQVLKTLQHEVLVAECLFLVPLLN